MHFERPYHNKHAGEGTEKQNLTPPEQNALLQSIENARAMVASLGGNDEEWSNLNALEDRVHRGNITEEEVARVLQTIVEDKSSGYH